MNHPAASPPTELLGQMREDARWLRQLAGRLASGPEGDDLMQDTWLVALRRSRTFPAGLRPWLIVTARNLWRRRRRDQRRHEALDQRDPARALPHQVPGADRMLERLELLRQVAELVEALPEPYRATVMMRFFEDRSAAEIARASGVPAGTVRWRLKEGLHRLRLALDQRHDGDRRRWALVLLPLHRPAAPALGLASGLTLAGATLAAAVVVSYNVRPAPPPPPDAAPTARLGAAPTPRFALAPPRPGATITGVVRDPANQAVDGAVVALFPSLETTMATDPLQRPRLTAQTVADAQGRFRFTDVLAGKFVVTATAPASSPSERWVTVADGKRQHVDLGLGTGGELLAGNTLDSGGGPVSARLTAVRMVAGTAALRFAGRSDARGQFRLRLPGGPWHLTASADGYAPVSVDLRLPRAAPLDLQLRPASRLSGRVLDSAGGATVAGATVRLDRIPPRRGPRGHQQQRR